MLNVERRRVCLHSGAPVGELHSIRCDRLWGKAAERDKDDG
jgi:hypothetical protein